MGGYGSGRRSNRWTTDDCLHINLSNLKQLSKLQRNWMARHEEVWSQRGQTIADLTLVTDVHCLEPSPCLRITGRAFGKAIDCVVYLEEQPLPYGGERWCDHPLHVGLGKEGSWPATLLCLYPEQKRPVTL